ncbi:hypothetical protein A3Q56_07529 [Intoshia linei]|uniref:Acetyl-coenzyme A transporter 1 n=1 Tax=Intoshia linei TaxID=1819745 RepID=A0A177ARX2_9BILA|nr:hypothetical protein A3Q56_07529 [Intoshia linei]
MLAYSLNSTMGTDDSAYNGNFYLLMSMFVLIITMSSTLDVNVDGWSLTMIPHEKLKIAAICNYIGTAIGPFLSLELLIIITSKTFHDHIKEYINLDENTQYHLPILLKYYLLILSACIFIFTTCLIFKKSDNTHKKISIRTVYVEFFNLIKHKPVIKYVLILITSKIGYIATEHVAYLRLIQCGLDMDINALITTPILLLKLIISPFVNWYVAKPESKPLQIFYKTVIFRTFAALIIAYIVQYMCYELIQLKNEILIMDYQNVTLLYSQDNVNSFNHIEFKPPVYTYIAIFVITLIISIFEMFTFLPFISFNLQISDPYIGGSSMTLFYMSYNIANTLTISLAMYIMSFATRHVELNFEKIKHVYILRDGYLAVSFLLFCFGLIIMLIVRRTISDMSKYPLKYWNPKFNK